MSGSFNQFHQPVGQSLSDWKGAPFPLVQQMAGRYCKLERINAERHAKDLYEAYGEASDNRDWTYLPVGPFETFDVFLVYVKKMENRQIQCILL